MKSFPGQQWAFAGMTVMDALNWEWNELRLRCRRRRPDTASRCKRRFLNHDAMTSPLRGVMTK